MPSSNQKLAAGINVERSCCLFGWGVAQSLECAITGVYEIPRDAVVTSVPDDVVASAPPHALPPFGGDRSDRAMQNIVDKVFPHFAKEEAAAEKAMQRAQEAAAEGGQNEKAAAESENKRNKVDGGVKKKKKLQQKDMQVAGQ